MTVNPTNSRRDLILGRIGKLRLPQKQLAVLANLNENTVNGFLGGQRDARNSTITQIEAALERQELELRDYLVALHGVPQQEAA